MKHILLVEVILIFCSIKFRQKNEIGRAVKWRTFIGGYEVYHFMPIII